MRIFDPDEIASYTTTSPSDDFDFTSQVYKIDPDDFDHLCASVFLGTYTDKMLHNFKIDVHHALLEFAAWQKVDMRPSNTKVIAELDALQKMLKVSKELSAAGDLKDKDEFSKHKKEILEKRMTVATSPWLQSSLKTRIEKKILRKRHDAGRAASCRGVTDLPSLVMIDPKSTLKIIRQVIAESKVDISGRKGVKSSGDGTTQMGPRRQLARATLMSRLEEIFKSNGLDTGNIADFSNDLISAVEFQDSKKTV